MSRTLIIAREPSTRVKFLSKAQKNTLHLSPVGVLICVGQCVQGKGSLCKVNDR